MGQGHVVAAVAPPAEVELRKRFMEELDPLDAELFEQTRYTVYTRDEQGFVTGSQMRISEHRGVYTLATVGLWANLGQDWQSTVADKIEWQWRIRFGRIEELGDDEKAIVATLKSSGLRAKVEIEDDNK